MMPAKGLAQKIKTGKAEWKLEQNLPAVLVEWYGRNARPLPWREDCTPYHVWISEIMLQQTRVEVVKDYYKRFLKEVPTVEALAKISEERLLKLWEGLGYYSRARNLQKAAEMILTEYDGRFPDTYEQLLKLPGVGPYTAGAVASICFQEPVPAVDGNVLRIIARIAGISDPVDAPATKKGITDSLARIYPKEQRGDFTQSLMELGATVCLPRGMPKCRICPVAGFCTALQSNSVLLFPVKQGKRSRKIQKITVLVLGCRGALAIRRRGKEGLLAGLWEFPNIDKELDEQQALELAAQWETTPVAVKKTTRRTHVFTHIKWEMTCYYIDCGAQPVRFTWVDYPVLAQEYALPTAFKMFLDE
ncbi:MAG: A/G-specific adenine glycosylase [Peptococcaceae bacterium]